MLATDTPSTDPSIDSSSWLASINKAIPAIVVIRVNTVRAFDGYGASYSQATGFIVDKSLGIILTNRHVVKPGPVTADAVFMNKEEVTLRPIYRDPVHDFGFFQFDPSAVNFLQLTEIELAPHAAEVGVEIRVVGNDNGEKLSILPGILARLDRDAPNYGSRVYNDFNTFYYSAASSTSGGSSGSPVLNIEGQAVALNAGSSKKGASSFYSPLDRAERALKLLQQSQMVTRGTLQTIFRHSAFDELRRLGLDANTEAMIRETYPEETGALVVDQVVPSSCAHDKLQPGDVLVKLNGEIQTTFIPIESYLDEHIGEEVHMEIQRGGNTLKFSFKIQDLHTITPSKFLECSGGIFHSFSYQQARNASLPVGGVYVALPGHMLMQSGLGSHCIITAVGQEPTPTLEDFITVLSKIPNKTRTTLRHFLISDRHRIRTAVITMDRQWFSMQIYTRNDEDGFWYATPCPDVPDASAYTIPTCPPAPLSCTDGDEHVKTVLKALVLVSFAIPYRIDGVSGSSYTGAGIIVDKKRGMVLVDRNTVPIALGDVLITVAASLEIPGEVVFVHPIHNYALVNYDPLLLGNTPIEEIEFSTTEAIVGNKVQYVGLSGRSTVVTQKPVITKIDRLDLGDVQTPRYRATNIEVVHFDRVTASAGGVFLGEEGKVMVLWLSFSYQSKDGNKAVFGGVPVKIVKPVIEQLKSDQTFSIKMLPIQLFTVLLSKARAGMGLPDEWAKKLELCHGDRRRVLAIKRCTANTNAFEQLHSGDLVLSVDGKVVSKDFDVESAAYGKETVNMTVFRDFQEVQLTIQTSKLPVIGTNRVLLWSGLYIQAPHYAVISIGYCPPNSGGVYCSGWRQGSPAHKYGLKATIWIVEVNGNPTPTMDDFIAVVEKLKNNEFVRMKTIDLHTKVKVFTLKTDYHYFPTVELRLKNRVWEMVKHNSN